MSLFRPPRAARIFEVGPRDGLQNEKAILPPEKKLEYIGRLVASGLRDIEVGAFVREDRVPQMAHSDGIFRHLRAKGLATREDVTFWALVPNEKGLDRALAAGCRAVAVFTGATDTFTRRNIGMTVAQSLEVFERVALRARGEGLRLRGYVSTCWGCPYEGEVPPARAAGIAKALLGMGVEQVSLGDTIGVATPTAVVSLLKRLSPGVRRGRVAGHFHDTRGTALANYLAAMSVGVRTFDASSAGLGGCNYAPGASGNVATEDLVYMLEGMGVRTGVDLDRLCEASRVAIDGLGRPPFSRYYQAWATSKAADGEAPTSSP